MTKPLSPAAASIVQAFDDRYEINNMFNENWQEDCIAAALRAAADQIVPPKTLRSYLNDYESGVWEAEECVRTGLLAIADELEGTN